MRSTIRIGIVLLVLWLAYAVWPFFGMYRLVGTVQARDTATLVERVDFPALRRSLTVQIVRTYLRLSGKAGQPGSIVEQFTIGVASSVADPIVAKLVSPESLVDLLQNGRPSGIVLDGLPSIEGLSAEAMGNVWRLYLNSELGLGRFFISLPVDKPPAQSFRLQFCLTEWTWKLCGVELPEQLQVRLAQEIIKTEKR
jgi:hypothetical protein